MPNKNQPIWDYVPASQIWLSLGQAYHAWMASKEKKKDDQKGVPSPTPLLGLSD